MSLKAELETWANALKAYDEEDFEKALDMFSRIADSSKILTNMGLIYATLGEHEAAVEQFNAATSLDQYLAVAYVIFSSSSILHVWFPMSFIVDAGCRGCGERHDMGQSGASVQQAKADVIPLTTGTSNAAFLTSCWDATTSPFAISRKHFCT